MDSARARRWLDVLTWAQHLQQGDETRRSVVQALSSLAGDLRAVPRAPADDLVLADVEQILARVKEHTTDLAWAHDWARLRQAAARAGAPEPIIEPVAAPTPLVLVEANARAVIETFDASARQLFVWVQPGDIVQHRSMRQAIDDRWPQDGRIEQVDGCTLRVQLLGSHRQPLHLSDTWGVDAVRLPADIDLDGFTRAGPNDAARFGLLLALGA